MLPHKIISNRPSRPHVYQLEALQPTQDCIEDNQFTQALKSVWEEDMVRRGVYMDVELLKHGGHSKALRIEALVPRYERGGIYHIKHGDTNFCKDLESELSMFPKATNDDASD